MTYVKAILKILAEKGPMDMEDIHREVPRMPLGSLNPTLNRLCREGRLMRAGHGIYGTGPLVTDLKALQKLCEAQEKEIARLKGKNLNAPA
jgi:hypothetical protein